MALGAALRQLTGSYKMSGDAAALLKAGDVAGARAGFQQALVLEPGNPDALYGMARCAVAAGDAAGGLGYYRRVVYRQTRSVLDMDGSGYRETDVSRLMEFVFALSKAGQAGEAVAVYNYAAGLLNYRDADLTGKPSLAALLPTLGDSPGQVPYTRQRLQGMAHLAIGIEAPGFDVAELRQAVALAPDSAAAYFYLGKYLFGHNRPDAKATLEKAVELGGDQMAAAAKDYLNYYK